MLENNRFSLIVQNNYNPEAAASSGGIGLFNVRRRLEVLYPQRKHELEISRDELFYTVTLNLQLEIQSPGAQPSKDLHRNQLEMNDFNSTHPGVNR